MAALKIPRWAKGVAAGLGVGLVGVGLALTGPGDTLETDLGLAWMFRLRGPVPAPSEVAVVAINASTAREMGLPGLPRDWPRATHGKLIDSLVQQGAAAVVFDLDMQTPREPADDQALAASIARSGRVVLFEALDGQRQPVFDAQGRQVDLVWVEKLTSPTKVLAEAAKGLGPFPLPKEQIAIDEFWAFKTSAGEVATMPAIALQLRALSAWEAWRELLLLHGATDAESLPRSAAEITGASELRNVMRLTRVAFKQDPGLADRLWRGIGTAPANAKERRVLAALIGLYSGGDSRFLNFYGPPGSIATVNYHQALAGASNGGGAIDLAGRTVFVGFSDLFNPGQPDRFYTVFTGVDGVDLAGVEIAATAFGNLLQENEIRPTPLAARLAQLFVFGVLMGTGIYLLPALAAVPLATVLVGLYAAGTQLAFERASIWLPLATPALVQFPLALFAGLIGQYLFERRQKQHVSDVIRRYLPEHVARALTQGVDLSQLEQDVHGTCLCTDMAGFTSITEHMKSASLAQFMNEYFETLARPLETNKATITKFHADTIMCAWTGDADDLAQRERAVRAALGVVAAIDVFNAAHAPIALNARVGLGFDSYHIGHTGGGGHLEYDILGRAPNVASRTEGLNKLIGTHILATAPVVEGLETRFLLRPLGLYQFVGLAVPTPIVEVMAAQEGGAAAARTLCARFAEALRDLETRQWERAAAAFRAILVDYPHDGATRFLAGRAARWASEPPADDAPAVVRLDTK